MSYVKFEINRFDIVNSKIDKNIKIMLMSDMHNREISERIVKAISEEEPDYIIMSGDMINESIKYTKNFIKLLDKIDSDKIEVTYDYYKSVTPGQEAVFYYDDLLIGSGTIDEVYKDNKRIL